MELGEFMLRRYGKGNRGARRWLKEQYEKTGAEEGGNRNPRMDARVAFDLAEQEEQTHGRHGADGNG